jgi:D-alanyl-D-alanine carboxypeptidase
LGPEALIGLILDREPLFPPGEAMAYSDTGYLLLGLVIEEVTGQSYEQVIEERFILPLRLESTGASNRKDLPGLAQGSVSSASGLALPERTIDENGRMRWNPAVEWTGGGLYSAAPDLARWGRAFLSGRLLSKEMYRAALGDGSIDESEDGYGLGVAIRQSSEYGPVYGHRGWIPGYVSSLQYYPDYDTAIAFQINTDVGFLDGERPVMAGIEARLAGSILMGGVRRTRTMADLTAARDLD